MGFVRVAVRYCSSSFDQRGAGVAFDPLHKAQCVVRERCDRVGNWQQQTCALAQATSAVGVPPETSVVVADG
jgi:hypothetical protein